jgi:hypothetical protein
MTIWEKYAALSDAGVWLRLPQSQINFLRGKTDEGMLNLLPAGVPNRVFF